MQNNMMTEIRKQKINIYKSRKMATKIKASLFILPAIIMSILFLAAPLIWIVIHSFIDTDNGNWTLANYITIFTSHFYRQAFTNTLWLSIISSLLGLFIAVIFSISLSRVENRLQHRISAFINMVSNFSGVPLVFAFIIILGTNGALTLILKNLHIIHGFNLYSSTGLILIYTYFQVPLGILVFYPTLSALNKEWEESASLLGASKIYYWRHIAIPIIFPGLIGTFIILIASAMGAYASAYALTASSYNLVTIRIVNLVAGDISLNPELASAMSVLLMLLLITITIANQLLIKRYQYAKK